MRQQNEADSLKKSIHILEFLSKGETVCNELQQNIIVNAKQQTQELSSRLKNLEEL